MMQRFRSKSTILIINYIGILAQRASSAVIGTMVVDIVERIIFLLVIIISLFDICV